MRAYVVVMLDPKNAITARLVKTELPAEVLQDSLNNPDAVQNLIRTLGLPWTPECLLSIIETNMEPIEIVCG